MTRNSPKEVTIIDSGSANSEFSQPPDRISLIHKAVNGFMRRYYGIMSVVPVIGPCVDSCQIGDGFASVIPARASR